MAKSDNRERALDSALAQIEKQFGKGSVMRLGDENRPPVEVIPTGAIALDIALGIGGLPRGRIVEIYGPESSGKTTVALHAIASAQAAGGVAAFIDAEHALDPEYAAKLGVDIDGLLVSQPDTGEQALEIADMLIRSGALDILVIDSVAALVPRAEIEGDMGDSHVGLQARLMSQALRKMTGALSGSGTTMIFINQLREKIGVMFGCMSYSTKVTLADGTQEEIGKIVDKKLDVEVLSYDVGANALVPGKITNWFDNGVTDQFLEFTVAGLGANSEFSATENHLIRTPGGWRPAGELIEGDRVLTNATKLLSEQQYQIVLGSLLGRGELSRRAEGESWIDFGFKDPEQENDYHWTKIWQFNNLGRSSQLDESRRYSVEFGPFPELTQLHESVYFGDRVKHINFEYLKAITPLSLAIWYQDQGELVGRGHDGTIRINVSSLSGGSQQRLADYLRDTHGYSTEFVTEDRSSWIRFSTESSSRFQTLVAQFVDPSMDHKLKPELRGQFDLSPSFVEPADMLVASKILSIETKRTEKPMRKFDIEVGGTHNYFVDGVMVHNSPETTTGGKALKFYASIRLDVRRIETLKDGTEAVGSRTRVKVVKNKMAPPFKQAEFDIVYGEGISREGSLIDMGVEHGFVRKAGAWYTYDGDQLGQGKENARNFLKDNPDLANELEKRIKEKLGVGAQLDAPAEIVLTDPQPASTAK